MPNGKQLKSLCLFQQIVECCADILTKKTTSSRIMVFKKKTSFKLRVFKKKMSSRIRVLKKKTSSRIRVFRLAHKDF